MRAVATTVAVVATTLTRPRGARSPRGAWGGNGRRSPGVAAPPAPPPAALAGRRAPCAP